MAIKVFRADVSYAERIELVGRLAFADDGWQFAIFPPRLRDPNDPGEMQRFMLERMQARLKDEGVHCIVAVDEDARDESGKVQVLAYAAWHEPGKGENADDDPACDGPEGETAETEGWVEDGQGGKRGDGKKYPRIMDVEAWWRVNDILKTTKDEILDGQKADVWYLGSLAVDPQFAGRGIASQLVQWGIDKAEADKVPVYLESTVAAKRLYARLGFQYIKEMPTVEDGGKPHTAMLRKPSTEQSQG